MQKVILILTILCFLGNTYAKERVSYFTTSDSIEIGYIQYGNENLTNMVFVHGGPGDNSSSFRKMAKQLSSDFRVTLFDFRGCGLSTRNLATKDLTIPNYVNDIKELLDHLEIDSSILLGHSFGGAIAVEFASIYPNRIKQLILSNPFTSGLTAQKNRFEQSYKLALDENDTIKINAYDQWLAGDSITIWDEAKMLDSRLLWHNPKIANRAFTYNYKSLGYSQEEFESGFDIVVGYYDSGFLPNYSILDKLENLKVKTVIIGASHDLIASASDLKNANELIPNCELYEIDNSGHFPFLEKPSEFKTLIIKVCNKT